MAPSEYIDKSNVSRRATLKSTVTLAKFQKDAGILLMETNEGFTLIAEKNQKNRALTEAPKSISSGLSKIPINPPNQSRKKLPLTKFQKPDPKAGSTLNTNSIQPPQTEQGSCNQQLRQLHQYFHQQIDQYLKSLPNKGRNPCYPTYSQ